MSSPNDIERIQPGNSDSKSIADLVQRIIHIETILSAKIKNWNIHSSAAILESKLSLNYATHSNTNDPTADQKAALAGTDGTPSGTNKYVTDSDDRLVTETFETSAFNVAAGDNGTATVTYSEVYASAPIPLPVWDNSVGTVYSEDFESYSVGTSMLGAGNNQWTMRYQTGTGTFAVITGKYGELKDSGGAWHSVTCNNSSLASLADYKFTAPIVSLPGGRAIIGGRITSSGGYFVQCLPSSQLRLYKTSSWDFITGQTQLAQWDASAPASLTSLAIGFSGTTITVYANGSVIGTHTDASFSQGTIGLCAYGSGGWQQNNLLVENIAGTENVFVYLSDRTTTGVTINIANHDASVAATGKVIGIVVP